MSPTRFHRVRGAGMLGRYDPPVEGSSLATATGRKPRKLNKSDLAKALNGQSERLMHLDLVGTAEAAQEILHVERARIGKWRRKGILLSNGERIDFPEPIYQATTAATEKVCNKCATHYDTSKAACPECGSRDCEIVKDYTKLAATPLWWADDIRALKKVLDKNRPRD